VTGILNWLAIPLIVLVTAAVASQSDAHNSYVLFVPLAALVLSSVMIVAGLKMKRLETFGLAITGSILAILITPGNVIGLPIGIWALVVLSHRQVRQAFGTNHPLLLPRTEPPQANRGGGRVESGRRDRRGSDDLAGHSGRRSFPGDCHPNFNKEARERARAIAAAQDSPPPMTALLANFGPVREVTLNDIDDYRGG